MEFRQLHYLLTVAEEKNVTRAAEKLFISQSALSHYIKNVEEELGTQLFDRSTNPISLTYAGECYMESARRILLEQERLTNEIRDITNHMSGKLVVGSSRDRASYMMPRLLPSFAKKYPGIEVEVYTGSGKHIMEALREGRVDLVLLPRQWDDKEQNIETALIYQEELVLAARKGVIKKEMLLSGSRALKPKAMEGLPFFLLFQEHAIRAFCDSYFKQKKIRPEIKMQFSSNITSYRMASTGMGVTIIPYLTTRMSNVEEEVELFPLGKEPVTWDVVAFYRKDYYMGLPEQDFIALAQEVFANESL